MGGLLQLPSPHGAPVDNALRTATSQDASLDAIRLLRLYTKASSCGVDGTRKRVAIINRVNSRAATIMILSS